MAGSCSPVKERIIILVFPGRERLRATPAIQEKAFEYKKISFILCNVITERTDGPEGVAGLSLRNLKNSGVTELPVSGVLLFVGIQPILGSIPPEVERDSSGFIITDRETAIGVAGVFRCRGRPQKGRIVMAAAGDGTAAALNANRYIENNS